MEWELYNAAEADGTSTGSSQEMFGQIDISVEITAVDERMVEQSFAGQTVAGQEIEYSFNRWGSLEMMVAGHKAKGGLAKGIFNAISVNRKYFRPKADLGINGQWVLTNGILFPNGAQLQVGILSRGQKVVGIYKAGTDVAKTIQWYETMVYKNTAWNSMRIHHLRDYKPEFHVDDDLYAMQEPEFTREVELEEIANFITSLRARKRSQGEEQILSDIKAELDSMV